MDNTKLRRAIQRLGTQFESRVPVHRARVVGDPPSGNPHMVEVDILRPDGSVGERREVIKGNKRIWPGALIRVAEMRVLYGPGQLAMATSDLISYSGSAPPDVDTPLHGESHGYNRIDEVPNLHPYQMYPLRVQPTDPISMSVDVLKGLYFCNSEYHRLDTKATVDLTAYKPAAGFYRYVTLSLDEDGDVTVTSGSQVVTPTPEDIPLAPANEYTLSAVLIGSFVAAITRYVIEPLQHLNGIADSRLDIINKLIANAVNDVMFQLDQHIIGGP